MGGQEFTGLIFECKYFSVALVLFEKRLSWRSGSNWWKKRPKLMVVDGNDDDSEAETRRRIDGNSLSDGYVDVSVFLFDCNPQAVRGTGSPMAIGNY
jgi:hypothetical protein